MSKDLTYKFDNVVELMSFHRTFVNLLMDINDRTRKLYVTNTEINEELYEEAKGLLKRAEELPKFYGRNGPLYTAYEN